VPRAAKQAALRIIGHNKAVAAADLRKASAIGASRVDRRTVRHPGYWASQRARKRIEEAFAWVKTIAGHMP
jgi:hypothetical protein